MEIQQTFVLLAFSNLLFAMPVFIFGLPTSRLLSGITALLLLFFLLGGTGCSGSPEQKAPVQPDSHQKMLDILAETRKKIFQFQNSFCAEARLQFCDSLLATTTDPSRKLNFTFIKAGVLLEYGDEEQAVALYESLANQVQGAPDALSQIRKSLAIAYLRLAERNNCINGHAAESCIMPIKGSGIHQDQIAGRKAVQTLEALLESDPNNPEARWLLNIAYMTLGEYPRAVPKHWLIPGLDTDDKLCAPFVDLAPDLGIAVNNRAGGSIVDDFDNDGYLDLVLSGWGLDDPMHFFHNNADGTFSDYSSQSGLAQLTGGLNLLQTDYNNDGWLDIFVLRGGWQSEFGKQPNSLLRNNGDGTFTDVTIDAGLLSFHPTQTATWNDFNQDGWLDLFIGNETLDSSALHPCELYINNQDGTFSDAAAAAGLNFNGYFKGVASGDYDNDGWPDLFLTTMNGVKALLRNKGQKGQQVAFENVSAVAGFEKEIFPAFPTWFWDYNNDGWLDIFVCNYDFERPLSFYAAQQYLTANQQAAGGAYIYRNNGDGTFTNVTRSLGLNQTAFAMGANFGDIDNDGYLDFYLGTGNPNYSSLIPNKLFRNLGGQRFGDATISSRLGQLQKGHGVSFADVDNDGDQDIHIDLGGAYRGDAYPNAFYLNQARNTNHWICLDLEGVQSNKAAIGVRVVLTFQENGQQRKVVREVNSGGSFGCSPFRREIGLGNARQIDMLQVFWPASGTTQTFEHVPVDRFFQLREGASELAEAPIKPLVFKKSDGTIPMCAPVQ
ncbi:MAG: CRTAC1 family protein [Bacteroidetes bacterium]|nr:MAG: CRTAC1 family protein [Bacteroidota bacterium]